MLSSIEHGTPAVHGRRKSPLAAEVSNSDVPMFSMDESCEDTPTALRRQLNPSSPAGASSPCGARSFLTAGPRMAMNAILALAVLCCIGTVTLWVQAPGPPAFAPQRRLEASLVDQMVALHEQQRNELHDEFRGILREQIAKLMTSRPPVDAHAAGPATNSAKQVPAARGMTTTTRPATPALVKVWFIFDVHKELGAAVELYWLSHNRTERHYSTIPAGQRVEETTQPGACWVARSHPGIMSASKGNTLLTYCATAEPKQYVRIVPKEQVSVAFHFPLSRHLPGTAASLYELLSLGPKGVTTEQLVGTMLPGEYRSIVAKAGARFRARDSITKSVIVEYTASFEAEQHVDVAVHAVKLELQLAPAAPAGEVVDVYWIETKGAEERDASKAVGGDAPPATLSREHFYGALTAPGQTLEIKSAAGEGWVARRRVESADVLLEITLTESAEQHHVVVLPPPRKASHVFPSRKARA